MKFQILILLVLICFIGTAESYGQGKTKQRRGNNTKKSSTASILADAKLLTAKEREYCLSILKILDASDAIFTTTRDPYKFKDSVRRAVALIVNADKELRDGNIKTFLRIATLAYMDAGVLASLGATRHVTGTVDITDEQAANLGEIKRRYNELLNFDLSEDLLDPDVVAKIYRHALKVKEGLYEALR